MPRRCPPSQSRWNPPAAAAFAAAVDEADEFEVGSLYKAGSKKQSLNHLLNFQFAPRAGYDDRPNARVVRGGAASSNAASRKFRPSQNQHPVRSTYRKEHYLQANCQFVVRANGDYSRHATDPDLLVDWNLIEQVRLRTSGSEPTSCPICLFPPTAAKISRCGHVFCWPCILHYLALSDDNWRKCPICYEAIQKTDLRSVATVQQANYATGGLIEMRLMQRERNSLLAVPFGWCEDLDREEGKLHVKLIKASRAQVADTILAQERQELEFQFAVEGDQPESCFIQEALRLLDAREIAAEVEQPVVVGGPASLIPGMYCTEAPAKVQASPAEILRPAVESLDDLIQMTADLAVNVDDGCRRPNEPAAAPDGGQEAAWRPRHISSSSDLSSEGEEVCLAEGEGAEAAITAEDLDISAVQQTAATASNSTEKPAPKNIFYFYQSSDGQPIFLHALNVQMLVEEYGCLENCPLVIRASILEKDSSTMTEDLRDRLRYLRHLPLASSFEVAELELGEPVLSKATAAKFREQLESRRRKRARKQREERRREKRIQAEENRLMGRFPGPMVRIESAYHYPQLGSSSGQAAVEEHRRGASPAESLEGGGGSADTATPDLGTSPAAGSTLGLNFAKIIREGAARPGTTRPSGGPRTAPIENRAQWRHSGSDDGGEGGIDGWAAPPTTSLGDALAAALARAETQPNSAANKKKGKKGRPILLSGGAVRPRL